MGMSYTGTGTGSLAKLQETRRHVLITGAGGRIGSYLSEHSHARYDLRLMVQKPEDGEAIRSYGEVVVGDLLDLERMKAICEGIDTVVHLAGDPNPAATWKALLDANIIGTYHAFVAAKSAGCRRVIHASSIHAVSGYPPDRQVHTSDPVNPGDLYGVSKCFGESLGRYMAEQEGLSVIALRIGGFQAVEDARNPHSIGNMDAFVSKRDLTQLIHRCIDIENLQFAIFHGLSNNRFKRLDITDARELLGYDPQDDFTQEYPQLKELHLSTAISTHSLDDPRHSGIREEL